MVYVKSEDVEAVCRAESLKYGDNADRFMAGACDNFMPDGFFAYDEEGSPGWLAYSAGYAFADEIGNVE